MIQHINHKKELEEQGFSITKSIFSNEEINVLLCEIQASSEEYAIRQLVNKFPKIKELIFNNNKFRKLFNTVCNDSYFLSKAIYFNKPSKSNWFVGYHQDVSVSVVEKQNVENYTSWTKKNGQIGVIPPKEVLENTITFRIHLDKTDATNGALKIISNSHKNGVIRIDNDFDKNNFGKEIVCIIDKGGLMLMKPLLLHSSSKSISESDRRVIHLEFCNKEIPMKWLEKREII